MKEAKSCSIFSGKERMRCTSPAWRGAIERLSGAGKALSRPDAGSEGTKRERQEVLVCMVANKWDMQKEAPKKYPEKMFKEFKE